MSGVNEKLYLLPAVDVQNGQAVQLTQGVAGSEKVFGDPLAAALRWQHAGAQWLHLVDLDAAFGRGSAFKDGAVVIEQGLATGRWRRGGIITSGMGIAH